MYKILFLVNALNSENKEYAICLKKWGHKVTRLAYDEEYTLKNLSFIPNIILCDEHVTLKQCGQVISFININFINNFRIPLIILSSSHHSSIDLNKVNLLMDCYISNKPLDYENLKATIDNSLIDNFKPSMSSKRMFYTISQEALIKSMREITDLIQLINRKENDENYVFFCIKEFYKKYLNLLAMVNKLEVINS